MVRRPGLLHPGRRRTSVSWDWPSSATCWLRPGASCSRAGAEQARRCTRCCCRAPRRLDPFSGGPVLSRPRGPHGARGPNQRRTMSASKLLIADDERHIAEGLQMLLQEDGYEAETATDGEEAWQKVQEGDFGLVLADLKMPGIDGLELFARMREMGIDSEIIFITGKGTVDDAVEAMRQGAYDYLTKPLDLERLKALIPRALEKYQVRTANRHLQKRIESLTRFGEMIGQSEEMRQIYTIIEAVAPSTASVLIVGESGTGKELVARAIHQKSGSAKGPFVALNCGAFPRA